MLGELDELFNKGNDLDITEDKQMNIPATLKTAMVATGAVACVLAGVAGANWWMSSQQAYLRYVPQEYINLAHDMESLCKSGLKRGLPYEEACKKTAIFGRMDRVGSESMFGGEELSELPGKPLAPLPLLSAVTKGLN